MEAIKFVYYQENEFWIGWLEEYPDYWTQGTSLEELKENLKDINNTVLEVSELSLRGAKRRSNLAS